MSYKLTCSSGEGYLRIRVDGTWPRGNPAGFMTDMLNLWAKHQRRPLLIDIRSMEDRPSVFEDYENAKRFAYAGFGQLPRIAVLDNLDRREANDFFENTAYNRGLGFRFFYTDEQDAINWLLPDG